MSQMFRGLLFKPTMMAYLDCMKPQTDKSEIRSNIALGCIAFLRAVIKLLATVIIQHTIKQFVSFAHLSLGITH